MGLAWSFPGGTVVKSSIANAEGSRDKGSFPGLGRSPGEGSGNPGQYSCLGNAKDRGAWWARAHEVMKSWAQLKDWVACMHTWGWPKFDKVSGLTPWRSWGCRWETRVLQRTCLKAVTRFQKLGDCRRSNLEGTERFPSCPTPTPRLTEARLISRQVLGSSELAVRLNTWCDSWIQNEGLGAAGWGWQTRNGQDSLLCCSWAGGLCLRGADT